MRILVSGSTGFLGSSLIDVLEREGHTILCLMRPDTREGDANSARAQTVRWDPVRGEFDAVAAEGADALVHLAGASIADGRWTAIGYYGNRGDETLTESSAPGGDFLSALCREWEVETARGTEFSARVVMLRFGVILAAHGGALPRMALPFKMGAGGRLGSGRQWMSWLTLPEAVGMIRFALSNSGLVGPANAVAPKPIQNADFTRILAKALHRPALFPAPAFALRLALGEMADALLLVSQRVKPSKLEQAGYQFAQPELAAALTAIYHKSNAGRPN